MTKQTNGSKVRRYGLLVTAGTLLIGILAVYQQGINHMIDSEVQKSAAAAVMTCTMKPRVAQIEQRLDKMDEKLDRIAEHVSAMHGWLLHNGFTP